MMRALVVEHGVIRELELDPSDTYGGIRRAIGNTITSLFAAPSDSPRYPIWGYCDDEFLLTNLIDWNVVLEEGTLYPYHYPIGGPIVITGGDEETGDSRGLTEAEIARFSIDRGMGMILMRGNRPVAVPTLRYRVP